MSKYTEKPISPALAAFTAAAEKRRSTSAAQLRAFNDSGAAHALALGLVHTPCVAQPDHSAKPVIGAGKQAREKAAKRAEKRQQASAAGALDNKELKACNSEHPRTRLKSNRQQNLQVAQTLYERAFERNDALHKTAHKLRVCSTAGAFRLLSPSVCHKTGQALCRSRVCPTCQRALAHKRRAAFLGFFDLNREVMKKFHFYHMVLTLRHSREEDIRDCLYTKYLLDCFKQLRGTSFDKASGAALSDDAKEYWNKRVAGGIYSIETVPGSDGSPHIHLHLFVLAKMPLWRKGQASEFLKAMRSRWLEITGNGDVRGASTQVHLEPVYTWKMDEKTGQPLKDAKGNKVKNYVTKQHARFLPGASAEADEFQYEHLRAGVAECAKYTLKTDEASLSQFSDSFLYDLIETRHRYYGRFGCLHSKSADSKQFKELNRLSGDFKDLTRLDADELRQLFNPETGEIVAKSATTMVITNFRNVKARTASAAGTVMPDHKGTTSEHYYSIIDPTKAVEYDPYSAAAVAKALSVTLYRRYKAEEDIATEDEAQNSTNNHVSIPLKTVTCLHFLPLPLNSYQYCWLVPIPLLGVLTKRLRLASVLIPYRRDSWPHTGR